MADTLTNPYLQMGLANMMAPNPYLNPAYQGKPLPMPGYYTGDAGNMGPTDAMGQLIPSFTQANNAAQSNYQQQLAAFNAGQQGGGAPGTTLNSTPGSPLTQAQAQASGMPGAAMGIGSVSGVTPQTPYGAPGTNPWASALAAGATPQQMGGIMGQMSSTIPGTNQPNPTYTSAIGNMMAGLGPRGIPTSSGSGGGGTPPTPPDLRQAYLDALAAPQGIGGNLPTPGAQGAQSPPPQLGQPSVLDSFLANNSAGGKAVAGNYSNAPFFNTLNRLNSGSGGAMAQSQGSSPGMNVAAPSMAAPSMGMPSAGMPTNRNLIGVG